MEFDTERSLRSEQLTLTLRQLLRWSHGLVDRSGGADVEGDVPHAAGLRRDRVAAAGVDRGQRLPLLRAGPAAAAAADPGHARAGARAGRDQGDRPAGPRPGRGAQDAPGVATGRAGPLRA